MLLAGPIHSGSHLRRGVRALLSRATVAAVALTLVAAPRVARAQDGGVIAGRVVTEAGARALAGVQVAVQDQPGKGTVTDAAGRFRITGVSGSQVVINVRMIGYRAITQTVNVGTTNLQFAMAERALELDQVVVTGTAGGEQKKAIGTSVDQVNVSDVTAKQVVPTVDGVRVDNQTSTGISIQAFSSGVISRLNDFDPDQIESIEVLKGPAAATLYGTEAARGVINIITKKGTTGGTTYSFKVSSGQNIFQNADGRIATNYCHVGPPTTAGGPPVCTPNGTGPLLGLNVVRRQDSLGAPLFRKGLMQNYEANVSGGSGIFQYFAAGSMLSNQGADPSNEENKKSVRTNLTITPNEKIDRKSVV